MVKLFLIGKVLTFNNVTNMTKMLHKKTLIKQSVAITSSTIIELKTGLSEKKYCDLEGVYKCFLLEHVCL